MEGGGAGWRKGDTDHSIWEVTCQGLAAGRSVRQNPRLGTLLNSLGLRF